MKASELRIGNLLEFSNGIQPNKIFSVGRRFFSGASVEREDGDFDITNYYNPIPITEEWLLKFGFEKRSDCEWIYEKFPIFVNCGNHNLVHIIATENTFAMPVQIGGVKVHQLQNLYFALTGEELTILNK